MMSKTVLGILALAIGLLQAWDSNALQAEGVVQGVILVAVLLPAAALAATRGVLFRGAAVALAAVLLMAARYVSAVSMPELALAALFPGILLLFDHIRSLTDSRAGIS